MALDRSKRYPGRFENPTTASPQGAFKNRTSPTAEDGSYFEADWANDWDGFFARVLNVAGVTPNGTVDDGTSSQLYTALMTATPGRLLNVRTLTASAIYTPTAGTKAIKVTLTGGGGGGGGCQATSTSETFSGAGGGAGGTVVAWITSPASSYSVTIGAGGAGGVGANAGSAGGNSVFGSLTAGGGGGGQKISVTNTPGGLSGTATGGLINIRGGDGSDGQVGTYFVTGNGGSSFWGGGGRAGAAGGSVAKAAGSGGGGAYDVAVSGTSYTGGAGAAGILVVEEYS
ncbi:hypothetical protein RCIP0033_00045 [Klebsiella phage RCIP0033]